LSLLASRGAPTEIALYLVESDYLNHRAEMEEAETAVPAALCPVCARSFRPRSLSHAWESVLKHISTRSRQGCMPHRHVHEALHRGSSRQRRTPGCPGCPQVFSCVSDACTHLMVSPDANHAVFHTQDRPWAMAPSSGNTHRWGAEWDETEIPSVPDTPEQELYGYAKAGDFDGVKRLLDSGLDPDAGGEDGYTPLMTAAEAGHANIVGIIANHLSCAINKQNNYGQSALSLAAQNNHTQAVRELLSAQSGAVDTEALCGNFTAAELARRAGHSALADLLATHGQARQMEILQAALSTASGVFDSARARIVAVRAAAGLPPAIEPTIDHEEDDIMDWKPICTICMSNDVDTALKPCFHACFCAPCADSLLAEGGGLAACPMCRSSVVETQQLFL